MQKQFILVSLKHTQKNDLFLTFWGSNNSGYVFSFDRAGVYESLKEGYHNSENTYPVEVSKIKSLFAEFTYDGKKQMLIPNCQAVWNELGLKWSKYGLKRIE